MTQQTRNASRWEHTLARGVAGRWDRPLAWIRRHPLVADAALAVFVLAVSAPHSQLAVRGRAVSLGVATAMACLLVWRRRAPLLVFAGVGALVLAQLLVSHEMTDDLALLAAFYTVAAYQPPRRVLAATAAMVAGSVPVTLKIDHGLRQWSLLAALIAGTALVGFYARTRRAYLAALVDRAQRLERERAQQAQLAGATERARIAREMHDIVAHNIAVMIALANGAAYTAADAPGQAISLMDQVAATGRTALAEMRRLLGVLREPAQPGHAPQPTLDEVADLLANVRAAGVPARLTVTGEPFPLPPSAQLVLYRMIQEALTNTLKHAPGADAEVCLAYQPGGVRLEVTDTGRPRHIPAGRHAGAGTAAPGGGQGITGMRERAAVFGGQVSAGPRPGGGWRVATVLNVAAPATQDGTGTAA